MRLAVLGMGRMGHAVAERLLGGEHEVAGGRVIKSDCRSLTPFLIGSPAPDSNRRPLPYHGRGLEVKFGRNPA